MKSIPLYLFGPQRSQQSYLVSPLPLPTIEDIATRLHETKVFTVVDVKNGFWHVMLDEQSSYLTTFHTPFGKYNWKQLLFVICSALEIFQRKMHEVIEGLQYVEIVADDFLVVSCGESLTTLKFTPCRTKDVVKHYNKLQIMIQRDNTPTS